MHILLQTGRFTHVSKANGLYLKQNSSEWAEILTLAVLNNVSHESNATSQEP